MVPFDDIVLFEDLKKGNKKAFSELFKRYYPGLCNYASSILKDDDQAEELVQDFFVKVWEKRQSLLIETSVKNYFLRSVKNRCINYLKQKSVRSEFVASQNEFNELAGEPDEEYLDFDLFDKIEKSILKLPEKRREVFILSRQKGLKYHEIANKLNLSVKTVEAHMGLAIKSLREMLSEYLTD